MKFYNITFDLNNRDKVLKPYIPYSASDKENRTIKRVCITDSVEHCMQAIATGNREVYKGSPFVLRVVEIVKSNNQLVYPDKLVSCGYVPDALENKEYWYLKPIQCRAYKCVIESFDYEYDIAWTCIKTEDCRRIVKRITGKEFNRCKSALSIYKSFCKWANEIKAWSMLDDVWDALVELPWAQKTKIYNLKYGIIEEL